MSYQSDDEQVQLLKNLWKDYGQPVILGVAITLASVSGYKYWQKTQSQQIAEASSLYQNLLDTVQVDQQNQLAALSLQSLTEEQKATVNHLVTTLQSDFEDSQYAAFATLFLAQQQVQDGQLEAARASLEWVLAQKPAPEVNTMATLRLARVLLAESDENGQKALDLLTGLTSEKTYQATIESVKGDAWLALGNRVKAEQAYQTAVDAARENGQNRPLLQLKLDDLAAMAPISSNEQKSSEQEG
ncbi:YfgM family protein [Endozoicomonas ascidiicola]|uniref:YfgM family protein n=1 Tax=Endozoicomonas ascidiicola TaxID=1698521 RepID=UPI00082F8B96|nr:tetratricopeptide repeat protein [Endozoicomonas ascidiicola]